MFFAITISQVDIELGNLKCGSIPTTFNGHAAWKIARTLVEKFDKETRQEIILN